MFVHEVTSRAPTRQQSRGSRLGSLQYNNFTTLDVLPRRILEPDGVVGRQAFSGLQKELPLFELRGPEHVPHALGRVRWIVLEPTCAGTLECRMRGHRIHKALAPPWSVVHTDHAAL